MKLLWSRDLVMNTVHVQDVVRSIWYLIQRDDTEGQLYNVVDDGRSTQGHVTDIISAIFNINCDYSGNVLSTLAMVSFNNSYLCMYFYSTVYILFFWKTCLKSFDFTINILNHWTRNILVMS